MATGKVKWYNPRKGYGFVAPDDGGKDAFIHVSALEKAGITELNEGDAVTFELATEKGRESALGSGREKHAH